VAPPASAIKRERGAGAAGEAGQEDGEFFVVSLPASPASLEKLCAHDQRTARVREPQRADGTYIAKALHRPRMRMVSLEPREDAPRGRAARARTGQGGGAPSVPSTRALDARLQGIP